jgi:hypothetical protein
MVQQQLFKLRVVATWSWEIENQTFSFLFFQWCELKSILLFLVKRRDKTIYCFQKWFPCDACLCAVLFSFFLFFSGARSCFHFRPRNAVATKSTPALRFLFKLKMTAISNEIAQANNGNNYRQRPASTGCIHRLSLLYAIWSDTQRALYILQHADTHIHACIFIVMYIHAHTHSTLTSQESKPGWTSSTWHSRQVNMTASSLAPSFINNIPCRHWIRKKPHIYTT